MDLLFSKSCLLLLLSVAYSVKTEEPTEDTLVQLKEGKIRGHILKSENGRDYYAFQEIPYAAPPVGKNRLQPPKKVDSWEGVLDTTKNTKICYQSVSKYSNLEISEDCLYINVYTPETFPYVAAFADDAVVTTSNGSVDMLSKYMSPSAVDQMINLCKVKVLKLSGRKEGNENAQYNFTQTGALSTISQTKAPVGHGNKDFSIPGR